MSKYLYVFGLSLSLLIAAASASARSMSLQGSSKTRDPARSPNITGEAKDEAEEARKAADVLMDMMNIREEGIPDELMEHAKGIAVIPNVVKAAFGLGGRFGDGLMSKRLSNGQWSAPTFIEVSGGSFGLQIGVDSTDVVLVFNDEEGIDALLDGKLELGANAGVAAGPVGRNAHLGTDIKLKSGVFSYSRSKGLFAGVSLGGTVVTIDDSDNKDAYGKTLNAQDIFAGRVQENDVVRPFVEALRKYTPSIRHTNG